MYIEAGNNIKNIRFKKHISQEEIQLIRDEIAKKTEAVDGILKYIMSWEGFCGDNLDTYKNSGNIAKNLFEALAPLYDIKIIVYLREQTSFIESIYTQEIHAGATNSFEKFCHSIDINGYHWSKLIGAYASVFGNQSIIVKKFEKSNSYNLINDFSSIIDSRYMIGMGSEENHNQGYNKGELEFALKVNSFLSDSEKKT